MPDGKTRDDRIYTAGVHEGQRADFGDEVLHSLTKGVSLNLRENEIYNTGFAYGVSHRPTANEESANESAGGASGASGASLGLSEWAAVGDGNPIAGLGAIIGAVGGLVMGFQAGGFLGAFFGLGLGVMLGYVLGILVTLLIGFYILYGIGWVIWHVLKFAFGGA